MIAYIGIDNGVSGSIGAVNRKGESILFRMMPTFQQQDYTKKKKNISRIHIEGLDGIIHILNSRFLNTHLRIFIERPMVNPTRFVATGSALRTLEATLIVLEMHHNSYRFVDSKEWQKIMLPHGVKGSDKLKKASCDIGKRLFPEYTNEINKQKDADGLLIAEAARKESW